MLDVAACCKVRASKSGLANVQSLRALKEVLGSTSRPEVSALESQHRYLLDAGGADVDFAGPAENQSTSVVCSSATQPALDGSVDRCSTEDSEIADANY